MATTKTLTPTNQEITLAAFTEKPDNRTNVTNDDKLADAVNALNEDITPIELTGITAGTRTTIGDSHCYRIGKTVVVNISVVTQAAMTDSEVMVNGFPHPTKAVPITGHGNTGLGNYQGWLSTGGKIMNNYDGFQSGKRYYFNFAYIAKD